MQTEEALAVGGGGAIVGLGLSLILASAPLNTPVFATFDDKAFANAKAVLESSGTPYAPTQILAGYDTDATIQWVGGVIPPGGPAKMLFILLTKEKDMAQASSRIRASRK